MPPEAAGRVVSRDVARVLALGQVVHRLDDGGDARRPGRRHAHGARLGRRRPRRARVGMVAPDDVIGGPSCSSRRPWPHAVGFSRPSSVVLWGFRSRTEIDQQLAASRPRRPDVRIRHSWDPPDPDGLLTYADRSSRRSASSPTRATATSITLEPGWAAAHLVARRRSRSASSRSATTW